MLCFQCSIVFGVRSQYHQSVSDLCQASKFRVNSFWIFNRDSVLVVDIFVFRTSFDNIPNLKNILQPVMSNACWKSTRTWSVVYVQVRVFNLLCIVLNSTWLQIR